LQTLALLQSSTTARKGMPLGIDCHRSFAIPRFAGQPLPGVFGPDIQTTMSAVEIVANEQVLRHNEIYFAGLVGHPNNKVASHMRDVGCSAVFIFAHISY
jgi:hypothetical protein